VERRIELEEKAHIHVSLRNPRYECGGVESAPSSPVYGHGFSCALRDGGGPGSVYDWIYWETGKVRFEARRQIAQNRLVPASAAIIAGAIVLVLWRLLR
jgi:hypothetical protein